MTSRKIPESAVENLVSDLEGKANVANTVTTNTTQTISAGKKISIGGTAAYGRTFEIMMPTSTESNPTENKTREIAFLASEGAGEWYEGSLTHSRLTTGESYTGLRAGRLVNGTYKEGALGVRILADGTTFATAPSTPDNAPANAAIVTVDYFRKFSTPTGTIIVWSASTPPAGYLICNGAAISRTTYAALFHVIGTTWGAGDGNTTFNIPNLTFGNYISNPTVYGTGAVMRVGANTAASVRNVFITSARAQGNILMAIDGGETSGNCFWAPEALGLYAKTDNVKTAKLCIKY